MALNSNELKELQQQLLASNATWQAGPTSTNRLSETEQKLLLGCLPEPIEAASAGLKAQDYNYPAASDLTNKDGHNYVDPVENQGICGSCVAFLVKATAETTLRWKLQLPYNSSAGYALPVLSAADIYYCGCNGGCIQPIGINIAMNYLRSKGTIDDRSSTYSDRNAGCTTHTEESGVRTKITNYISISNHAAMKEWLSTRGALAAAIQVSTDFFSYTGGVYSPTNNDPIGGHGLCVVGYSDELKAWKCKNSWGTRWGEDGYCWIAYGVCDIDNLMFAITDFASYISYPVLKLGDSQRHDQGRYPSIAVNNTKSYEAHQSHREQALWYHSGNTVGGWDEGEKYDQGVNPSIATNDSGWALEVHGSQSAYTLWYHLGRVKNEKFQWRASVKYDDGMYPSVALSNDNIAVEVHQAEPAGRLFYRVGTLDNDGIYWGESHEYERSGKYARVAVNKHGQVVEVHQATGSLTCWSTVGQINEKDKTITWQAATKLDDGIYPAVALDDEGRAIAIHQSQGPMTLWYQTGLLSPNAKKVEWSPSQQYDNGHYPVIALNQKGNVIEFHESEGEYRLWFRTGQLTDAKPESSVKAEQLETDKELQTEA